MNSRTVSCHLSGHFSFLCLKCRSLELNQHCLKSQLLNQQQTSITHTSWSAQFDHLKVKYNITVSPSNSEALETAQKPLDHVKVGQFGLRSHPSGVF